MFFTQLIIGNDSDNNFLSYFEENSYSLQCADFDVIIGASELRDENREAANGYRIFGIISSIPLSPGTIAICTVSAKLKASAPLGWLTINFDEISGYSEVAISPVTSIGKPVLKIEIKEK